jgi:hypothetical protein
MKNFITLLVNVNKSRTSAGSFSLIIYAMLCYKIDSRTKLSTAGQRAFTYTGPSTWNTLPEHLREAALFDISKQHLKTYLFD